MDAKTNLQSTTCRRPHAFLVPWRDQGHVAPMVLLAQRLASTGFFVTFAAVDSVLSPFLQAAQDTNLQFLPIPLIDHQKLDALGGTDMWVIMNMEAMKPGVELLITKLKQSESPVTCLVHDNILPWAQDVAVATEVARVAFWPMSAGFQSIHFYRPLLAKSMKIRDSLGDPEDGEAILTCIPGLAPVVCLVDVPGIIGGAAGLSEFLNQTSAFMRSADAAIVNSVYEIERTVFDALRKDLPIYTVGPLVPREGNSLKPKPFQEDDECLNWLNSQDTASVLYISFGTSGAWSEDELKELAQALEASEQPFLWVIRPTLLSEKSTFSPSNIFSDQTKRRSKIISWAPQLSVLQHPSVGGFLTHCGWNSLIEGIYAGVPMIGWPKVSDQVVDMRFISDLWKIGIALERPSDGTTVKTAAIEKAVRALFHGEEGKEARKRSSEFKNIVGTAIGEGGSSNNSLLDFLKDMTKRTNEAPSCNAGLNG